ncbi:MAG: ABC transporter permease [Euryarchaeota archaeon]|nr:ABC transporter permease [Euryarchaeota archaeon]
MGPLAVYTIKRFIQIIITLIVIMTLIFVLLEALPAKPYMLLMQSPNLTQQQKEAMIHQMGYDKGVWQRYEIYMINMFTFNFGRSFSTGLNVSLLLFGGYNPHTHQYIYGRVWNTLILFGLATILSYLIGYLLGAIIAWKRGSLVDSGTVVGSLVFYNMPSFWLGLIFIWIFAYQLGWFPLAANGWMKYGYFSIEFVKALIMPLTVLLLISLAGTTLLMRTSMLDVMGEEYIVTAKAKGLPERTVLFKHAARNALLPLVTSFVIALAFTVAGGVITEQVFTYPGVGLLYIQALTQLDFPIVYATLYIITLLVLSGNFIADILYGILDPRVRVQ